MALEYRIHTKKLNLNQQSPVGSAHTCVYITVANCSIPHSAEFQQSVLLSCSTTTNHIGDRISDYVTPVPD